MNMLAERHELSNKWDIYIFPDIHKKVEHIIKKSRFLKVDRSNVERNEVVDDHNSVVSLLIRNCSCRRWEVYGLPYNHACAVIMQTDTNVHYYIDDYFTVE